MGGQKALLASGRRPLADRLESFQPEELYAVWLELNGFPKSPSASHREQFWNSRGHRIAVALDLSVYFWATPVLVCALSSLQGAALMLLAVPLTMLAVEPRLPRVHPYGVAGPTSFWSDRRRNRDNRMNLPIPPPMAEVDLYALPVMERAAEHLVAPTMAELDQAIQGLVLQGIETSRQLGEAKELVRGIEYEIRRSDTDWQTILKGKAVEAERLLQAAQDRLGHVDSLRKRLETRRAQLAESVERLHNRRVILDKLAQLQTSNPEDQSESEAFETLVAKLLDDVGEAQKNVQEAQNIATAGLMAREELNSFVGN
ncbi:MAG: hypothetical protein JNM28_02760 [Armatimonadetes bacterium]|nr:hypothetical protein [Armatimonadota bacterium]